MEFNSQNRENQNQEGKNPFLSPNMIRYLLFYTFFMTLAGILFYLLSGRRMTVHAIWLIPYFGLTIHFCSIIGGRIASKINRTVSDAQKTGGFWSAFAGLMTFFFGKKYFLADSVDRHYLVLLGLACVVVATLVAFVTASVIRIMNREKET